MRELFVLATCTNPAKRLPYKENFPSDERLYNEKWKHTSQITSSRKHTIDWIKKHAEFLLPIASYPSFYLSNKIKNKRTNPSLASEIFFYFLNISFFFLSLVSKCLVGDLKGREERETTRRRHRHDMWPAILSRERKREGRKHMANRGLKHFVSRRCHDSHECCRKTREPDCEYVWCKESMHA